LLELIEHVGVCDPERDGNGLRVRHHDVTLREGDECVEQLAHPDCRSSRRLSLDKETVVG
jgi:hypothetical protein